MKMKNVRAFIQTRTYTALGGQKDFDCCSPTSDDDDLFTFHFLVASPCLFRCSIVDGLWLPQQPSTSTYLMVRYLTFLPYLKPQQQEAASCCSIRHQRRKKATNFHNKYLPYVTTTTIPKVSRNHTRSLALLR